MAVSDDLVERVAIACAKSVLGKFRWAGLTEKTKDSWRNQARAAIAALSTPDFVLPLAEEMLRSKSVYAVELQTVTVALRDHRDQLLELEETLLDAYRERGE